MKRLLRIFLNTATSLSLVLFVATIALWVRSYLNWDEYFRTITFVWDGERSKDSAEFMSWVGWLEGDLYAGRLHPPRHYWYGSDPVGSQTRSGWTKDRPQSRAELDQYHSSVVAGPFDRVPPRWRVMGIAYTAMPPHLWELRVPLWHPAVLTLLLPAARGLRCRSRRQKIRAGVCLSCGYDLRATPDRCPECGAVAAAQGARLPRP
jgi:hypothetical protein